jgi:LuxR family transcriptional activator of conjugal transfer of Ti plasmids
MRIVEWRATGRRIVSDRGRMFEVFRSFVDVLVDGADAVALRAALAEVSDAFDLPFFAYFSIPKGLPKATWLVSNYATEWTDRYVQLGYDRLDPVILSAKTAAAPFYWNEIRSSVSEAQKQRWFLEEAARFGITSGFTIPIPDPSAHVAAMSFASDGSRASFQGSLERHAAALQLVALYFHRHARRLLSLERTIDGIRLTSREFECLQWAAAGKSAWDIGGILNVSRRTAAFHLDNVRRKLGVRSLAQAVALFARSQR